ncbi:unnamed protein product [Phytophthora fragariaefolia]|uniref:Unnamed protein product n=1 Tax=Phytophthora fragariaefolia TaxID=1490495 RepID=A0A9W6Y4T2_9STRA|nr:unnamed protein product [Phytophthora fragariaefolia]
MCIAIQTPSVGHITCIFATYPTPSPRMGLDELKPGNTKRAKDTAISAFMAFVKCNRYSLTMLSDALNKTLQSDLKKMMSYLYKNASSSSDYQDAALLCLLWYLLGRASDLSLVRKQNLSVDATEGFFVRFIRMKTSEEQGLSLFPDADFTTCPLHAISTALITQTAPSVVLIDILPEIPIEAAVTLTPATPLVEVLNNPDEFAALASIAAPKPVAGTPKPIASVPTVCSHVNRLLELVAPPAGDVDALTSHSFRGGAHNM